MNSTFQFNTLFRFRSANQLIFSFPLKTLTMSLMISLGANGYALPINGTLSTGSASISSKGSNNLTITQSTQNAVLNWQSFNIGPSETVQFIQPNIHSVTLNRVLGSDPSNILGTLSANGKVFLVNPNGILFGKGAQINVGGLVASTLNITDNDFMANTYKFVGTSSQPILNQGTINTQTDGGFVTLLGANISNNGLISAKLGSVVLAAGTSITLDVAGDGLLNVTVNQGAMNALVQNGGLILATGGQVLLTAQAAGNLLFSVVNNTGVIEANTLENHNGTIKLLADMNSGTVNVGGTLTAQGGATSGNGGFIETSGNHVVIANNAIVNTLSSQGKTGLWLIDPVNYTLAVTGGDETPASVTASLATTNRLITATNDITVNDPISIASAQTLTLNAGHDVDINAPITAVPAGAGMVIIAGNNVNVGGALTVTAANSSINITAGNNVISSAPITAVAATSAITINAGNDLIIGGIITGTAANTVINLSAIRDVTDMAALTAVAANSMITINAGRDATNTAALLATAAGTVIDINAGRNVNVDAAIAASAAGSSISLLSGLSGIGPGVTDGTVTIGAAVASLNTTVRFNPMSYANTNNEITTYLAEITGAVDAKAWVFARANNKTYNGSIAAVLSFQGVPSAGGNVTMIPGTSTFDTQNVGTGKTVIFNGAAIGGQDAGRFALFASSGTTTANITPAQLTVTASAATKTYGQNPTLTAFTATGLAKGEAIGNVTEISSGTAANASVTASPYTITPNNAIGGTFSASNYLITYVNGALTVIPANLTVTASNASKIYGQNQMLTAFTTTGLLNGETIGSVTETSPGQTVTASVTGNPYAITPSNAVGGTFTATNYTTTYLNGALTVTPANLLVTVANATKNFGNTPILTAFTVTGLVNGDTIGAFTESSIGAIATASVIGSPYPITISGASGGTFNAANYNLTYINGLLTVMPQIQLLFNLTPPVTFGNTSPQVNSITPDWIPSITLTEIPLELLNLSPTVPIKSTTINPSPAPPNM